MKVQFNFEKKHFYIFLVVFAVFAGVIYVRGLASSVPPTPWHPLQEVATGSAGTASVDVDGNGIIDNSDLLNGKSSIYFEGLIQNANALSIQSQNVYWTGLPSNPKLCMDIGGTCGTSNIACSVMSGIAYYNNGAIVAKPCSGSICNTVCQNQVRCNGDQFAQCSLSTDKVYFQSGTCGNSLCTSDGECQCACSATTQPTYVKETYISPTTKCATFN